MLLETLSPSPRRTRAQNGVGLLPKEAATGRASPSRPRSAQPSGLVSPLVGGGREGAVGVAFLEAPPVRPPCRRTVRCFAPPRWMHSSPCSLDVGEVRAAVDNRRQKLLFVLLINGMCETSAPTFR